jgi:hypothetical protein
MVGGALPFDQLMRPASTFKIERPRLPRNKQPDLLALTGSSRRR